VLDAAFALGLIDQGLYREGKILIVPIVAMLSKLCMKK